MKVVISLALAAAFLVPAASGAPVAPVTKIRAAGFGTVLARRDRQAAYFSLSNSACRALSLASSMAPWLMGATWASVMSEIWS